MTEEKYKELIEKWRVLAKDKNEKGNLIRQASRLGCFGECASHEMETNEDRFLNWSNALYNCAKELEDLIKGIPPDKEIFLIIGTGKTPQGFDHYHRIGGIANYIGLKGHVNIHLHGEWETLVTPETLRMALVNLNFNLQPPTVTISL